MKNKKGFLLAEETLKIIIALICIGFLIYFLVSLYFSNKNSQDLELAKASLEHLINETNAGASEVEIYNPSTSKVSTPFWYLVTWPTPGDSLRPKTCENLDWENCVCICGAGPLSGVTLSSLANKCDSNGVCMNFGDLKLYKSNGFFSKGGVIYSPDDITLINNPPLVLEIDYQNKRITEKLK